MLSLLTNQLWPYIRPHKARMIGTILLSFVLAAIGGAEVRLVRPIFDKGLSPDASFEEVAMLAGILLVLGLLNFPCRFFHFYWIRYIVDEATCSVRRDIFSKLQRMPVSFFASSKQGHLISYITNDTNTFSQGFKSVVDLIREPMKAVVFLGMAFWSDWQLTLVIFMIAPFLIAIFSVSGKKVRHHQNDVQKEYGELTHSITEGIAAHKLTKAFNLENFVLGRFLKNQSDFFKAQMKTTFVEEMAHPLVEVVGAIAFSCVILFAHYRIHSGATSIGEFVAFVAALALFMDPIRKFSQANVKLGQARAASDRIFHLLDLPEEIDQGQLEALQFNDKIEIKNLSFSYGEHDVIKQLNLTINKGQKVALVGLSGSGKSTLINLLLGLYPVKQGDILIDGKSIQTLKLKSLRNLFGLVSQDVFLFNDSVLSNLAFGKDFSEQQILEALEVAYAHDFIMKLPQGLDTLIGDRGMRLSGGQQQRLTIARAYLQNPDILLFDEATSALDNESEKVVQRALERIAGHKTVIAVAHRLTTIQDFDCIYVMHDGKVVEQGNHQQLMSRGGEYAKLYELSLS